jgi:hypothetical protein
MCHFPFQVFISIDGLVNRQYLVLELEPSLQRHKKRVIGITLLPTSLLPAAHSSLTVRLLLGNFGLSADGK